MDLSHLFMNKFEIPLTVNNTEEVFDNITNFGNPDFIDSRLIQNVYMPVHTEDGTSGRPFWYNYSRDEYYQLIKRILSYKPVMLTYPHGFLPVIEKYAKLGVRNFMVSKWDNQYFNLKKAYKDLKIYRSIVMNSYNENVDERFDGIVIPYRKLLDLEWLKEKSKTMALIAVLNHFCKPNCSNLDFHLENELKNYHNEHTLVKENCPDGVNAFIPRQVVLEINPYISTFKLVDRLEHCFYYEKYINYYTKGIMLDEGELGDEHTAKAFIENTRKHLAYENSNLKELNCRFMCNECTKKCY